MSSKILTTRVNNFLCFFVPAFVVAGFFIFVGTAAASPLSVSCSGEVPLGTNQVTWTANASGGTGIYNFIWDQNNDNSATDVITNTYPNKGKHIEYVQVWDSSSTVATSSCLAYTGTLATIDEPNEGSFSSYYGTRALGISGNSVVGSYSNDSQINGFLYDGITWTSLNPPGNHGTSGNGFLGNNNIVGTLYTNSLYHGFIYNGKTWTIFLDPDANSSYPSTQVMGAFGNNIVGSYISLNGSTSGFIFNGTAWIKLDVPWQSYGTEARGVSGNNIVGDYFDEGGSYPYYYTYGFLYDGTTWTKIDAPGAYSTFVQGISGNSIVGYYNDVNGLPHGFLYNGTSWTTLDVPGADGTYVTGISGNNIIGYYYDYYGLDKERGFIFTTSELASIPITSITVAGAGLANSIISGQTLQVNTIILPANTTNQAVIWSVTNVTGSATINPFGLLTAGNAGTVTVLAKAADDSGVVGTKEITITPAPSITPTLSNSGQFKLDGTTPIAEGASTIENTVVFQGTVFDFLNKQVQLQVEVQPTVIPFTGTPTITSPLVFSWGQPISATASNLATGKYHWQARAVDSQGAASAWQEFGTACNVDFEVLSPLAVNAATLAKELINQPYLWGGKGWDFTQKEFVSAENVKSGYQYWNPTTKKVSTGIGIDCSGLVMWAYNRNFDSIEPREQNFIKYEGADGQYRYNTTPTTESQLEPGDLMFFDWDSNGSIDHVAMYVGESGGFNVVQARSKIFGIVSSNESDLKQQTGFIGFKKAISAPNPPMQIRTGSPVDLIVTDPNGFTITSTTTVPSDEEALREIPGELYYSIYNIEPDGTPQTEVYSPKLETGNYIIKPVKRQDAPAGAVYSVTVNSDVGTVVVADKVSVNSIPQNGYGVLVQGNSITKVDINPPTAKASTIGTLGSNGWYTGNVTVALIATDTESGIASINYSLDNGLTWLIYNSKIPIVINKEGTTTISYYSVDNTGNKADVNRLMVKIDKTTPEAKISVDPVTKDLLVIGVDNLSVATVNKDSSGNYIITDQAGHVTKLIFSKTYAGKILTYAKLTGIQYDNNPTVKLPSSYFLYVWNLLVNPLVLISQTIYVDGTYTIEAAYDKKSNKTTVLFLQKGITIKKQVFSGLEIIKLTTSKGIIGYEL
jgi:Cell wall-associated hydrolases (invasion-associated proteins)